MGLQFVNVKWRLVTRYIVRMGSQRNGLHSECVMGLSELIDQCFMRGSHPPHKGHAL